MTRWILTWLPMIVIAFANAALRELVYGEQMEELLAQAVSTLTLEIALGVYIAWVIHTWKPETANEVLRLGLFWSLLTIVFEFSLGRLMGHSWMELFQNYNVMAGRTWVAIPVWIAAAPYIFYRTIPSRRGSAFRRLGAVGGRRGAWVVNWPDRRDPVDGLFEAQKVAGHGYRPE
jgi:hypothetical protein